MNGKTVDLSDFKTRFGDDCNLAISIKGEHVQALMDAVRRTPTEASHILAGDIYNILWTEDGLDYDADDEDSWYTRLIDFLGEVDEEDFYIEATHWIWHDSCDIRYIQAGYLGSFFGTRFTYHLYGKAVQLRPSETPSNNTQEE